MIYSDTDLLPAKGGTVVPPSDFTSERPKNAVCKDIPKNFPRGRAHARINVLIACEESQTECLAFREAGCNAFSSDLQNCSGNHPEWHIVGDCRQLFHTPCEFRTEDGTKHKVERWHLVIAHPPCTYLSRAGAAYLYAGKQLNADRYSLGLEARHFFIQMLNCGADHIAVENPTPFRIFNLPKPSCVINPYEFGSQWQKRTLLWLENLPPLIPTLFNTRFRSYVRSTKGGKKRSKSFPQIAKAMVNQWLPIIVKDTAQ